MSKLLVSFSLVALFVSGSVAIGKVMPPINVTMTPVKKLNKGSTTVVFQLSTPLPTGAFSYRVRGLEGVSVPDGRWSTGHVAGAALSFVTEAAVKQGAAGWLVVDVRLDAGERSYSHSYAFPLSSPGAVRRLDAPGKLIRDPKGRPLVILEAAKSPG